MSFAENLEHGLLGEGEIADWLISRNWTVFPAYEIEIQHGKGPRLFRAEHQGDLVAPDLLAIHGNNVFWCEAKTKTGWTYYRIGSTWQDGIDRHHWRDYLRVQDELPWDVWLMFLHRQSVGAKGSPPGVHAPPAGLYGESVKVLRHRVDHEADNYGPKGMVYWNFDSLRMLATYPLSR